MVLVILILFGFQKRFGYIVRNLPYNLLCNLLAVVTSLLATIYTQSLHYYDIIFSYSFLNFITHFLRQDFSRLAGLVDLQGLRSDACSKLVKDIILFLPTSILKVMTSLNFADIRDLKIFTTISKINYTPYNLPYNHMFFPTHFSFLLLISKGINILYSSRQAF